MDNALRLLLMFRDHRLIGVAQASEQLGVGRSTAHRLLAMLQARELIRQDPATKAYTSGPALVDIGLSIVRQMDIRQHLRPVLEQLSRTLGETVHLMVLDEASALFLDSVESSKALRTSSRVGRAYPAHTTSGGKALLAELPPARLAELYPSDRLARLTPRSITTRSRLMRELEQVRVQGYATNCSESEPDIAAVAVVVRNAFGEPRAAIALSAPLLRLDTSRMPAVAKTMAGVAARASTDLA
ncbi:MAG: IclR family transcriptional regulator [Mycobacteriales bacterium]